jgi:hypothetical protein
VRYSQCSAIVVKQAGAKMKCVFKNHVLEVENSAHHLARAAVYNTASTPIAYRNVV